MSLRDPHDGREVPPNGNALVSANSIRGVQRVRGLQYYLVYTNLCLGAVGFTGRMAILCPRLQTRYRRPIVGYTLHTTTLFSETTNEKH